jgi:hypothetical protein
MRSFRGILSIYHASDIVTCHLPPAIYHLVPYILYCIYITKPERIEVNKLVQKQCSSASASIIAIPPAHTVECVSPVCIHAFSYEAYRVKAYRVHISSVLVCPSPSFGDRRRWTGDKRP